MYVLHLARLRPVLDDLDFGWIHLQSFFGKDEAEVLDGVRRKTAFVRMSIETMFPEMMENLADMFGMFWRVVGIN